MFRVNKLTDYATVVLIDMSQSGMIRPTQAISEKTGIPLPTVGKLMKSLVKASLVVSHRGVRGGYSLAKPVSEISVADVIEAIEGPIALTACVDSSDTDCCYQTLCPMSGKWNQVNGVVTRALRDVSLANMLSDMPWSVGSQDTIPGSLDNQLNLESTPPLQNKQNT